MVALHLAWVIIISWEGNMKQTISEIKAYEQDLIEKDKGRDRLFHALWNMSHLNWDFDPKDKAKMPNVRTLVDASPADALNNASIALSNTVPRWSVAPYGTSLFELLRTEKMEHCLATQFRKMNNRGVGTLLFDKMRSSILFDMIVTRIDDLEFQFKGVKKLSNLQKRVRSQGRFLGQVFDPRTIHVETSMGTFVTLLHVENRRAWDVYQYWKLYENNSTEEGKRVAEALRKMELIFKESKDYRKLRFTMLEFVSDDRILKHGYFSQATSAQSSETFNVFSADGVDLSHQAAPTRTVVSEIQSGKNDIVFADEENKLGFMNWSVRIGGTRMESDPAYQVNPMLAPLHWGNSWETVNILRSLVMSEPISRMFEAHQFQASSDGQRLPESDDGVIVGRRGDDVRNLPPAPLDPQAANVVQALQAEIVRTTGANVLSDVTSAATTPFATLNAMIQVAMSRLDINRRDGALSCADDALLMLRWVDVTKVPLMSYRREPKSISSMQQMLMMQAGEQVLITADDFDADQCEITVDIKPKTPTDYQQQILSAIQLHDKMQVPYEYLLETLGFENIPLLRNQWKAEQINQMELQTQIQIMAQQAAQEAQNQTGQQPGPQQGGGEPMTQMPLPGAEGISQSAMGALGGGPGMNPAMGGTAPQAFAPGMTREAVSGSTQGGAPISAGG